VVTVRGLVKRFGHAAALRGIDLELVRGQALAVLGANGAGKSTLLRLLAGLSRPSAGEVRVQDLPATHRASRARVGYVGHATGLYPTLTARENLIFAGRLYGLSDAGGRADAALAREGLAEVSGRDVGGFSRGMAQRLAIARGLIHDPSLVLLDEPFTGLDRRSAERLDQRLASLRREGRTLVQVTHDPQRAARTCDAALVLAGGRVALEIGGHALSAVALERALDGGDAAA
jgi:heme ABC exporter ATP-binding subunit CcmA